jgi:hypothetical protein
MNANAASSIASSSTVTRPVAARMRMLLGARIVRTLLRLAAPDVPDMKLFALIVVLALAGCGEPGIKVSRSTPSQPRFEAPWADLQGALRLRVDTVRNRLWVLTLDHVDIYDVKEKRLIQRIALPGWSVADYICQSDIALDGSGAAFISDNAQSRLWEVNADSFEVKEHVIRLINKEHWDIGFGGLAFTADGTLFGLDASAKSLWTIDINSASAHQVLHDTHSLPILTQPIDCRPATATAQ